MKQRNIKRSGSATVTLIVFIAIMTVVTTAAITTIAVNSLAANRFEQGIVTKSLAESGLENGLLRLLRDPINYTGETITTPDGRINIAVASDKKSITSTGISGNFIRTVTVQLDYTTDLLINTWQEIY